MTDTLGPRPFKRTPFPCSLPSPPRPPAPDGLIHPGGLRGPFRLWMPTEGERWSGRLVQLSVDLAPGSKLVIERNVRLLENRKYLSFDSTRGLARTWKKKWRIALSEEEKKVGWGQWVGGWELRRNSIRYSLGSTVHFFKNRKAIFCLFVSVYLTVKCRSLLRQLATTFVAKWSLKVCLHQVELLNVYTVVSVHGMPLAGIPTEVLLLFFLLLERSPVFFYYAFLRKTMLPTRKSVPKSSRQSDHTITSWPS